MKVAVVGNGNIYNLAHSYVWKSMKDVEIRATCDIVVERAEKACKDIAAKNYYTNMDDLLSNDDIDVVDLCVPTYEHARLSIAALKAGKHVICEKPIARNLESAMEMLKAAEKSGKGLYIGHTRRFDQRWRKIKEVIDSGKIGTPVYIRRCERTWLPFPPDYWHWDPEKSGGVLLDIGIHCANLINWFFGSKPKELFACGKMIREEAKANGVHDLVTVMIRYEDDKTAFIDASWAFPMAYAPFYSSLDIFGTDGRLEYSDKDANPMAVIRDRIDFPMYSPVLSANLDTFRDEIHEFLECIRSGKEPSATVQDACEALKVIITAEESMEKGRVIRC
jgi:UDP-N-acetylglucosamine 3-dehydrogenase